MIWSGMNCSTCQVKAQEKDVDNYLVPLCNWELCDKDEKSRFLTPKIEKYFHIRKRQPSDECFMQEALSMLILVVFLFGFENNFSRTCTIQNE